MNAEDLVEVFKKAWHEADEAGLEGQRTLAGVQAMLDAIDKELDYYKSEALWRGAPKWVGP